MKIDKAYGNAGSYRQHETGAGHLDAFMRTKKDSGRGRMEDEDLAITYIDEPGCRVLDLAKAGLREVPMLNFSRRRHFRGPTSPHRHAGCLEVGICLRGALTLLNNNREYRVMPGDLFLNKPSGKIKTPPDRIRHAGQQAGPRPWILCLATFLQPLQARLWHHP